jgi:hypothetical protein
METENPLVKTQEYIIINLPAFSFCLLIPAGVICLFSGHNLLKITGVVFIVWGVAGFLLLLADYYNRKKKLFVRLVLLNEKRDPLKHSAYLRSTVCGLCILWALSVRKKNTIQGDFYERKI